MRIFFTGATSFTGMWFAKTLAGKGHKVLAAIRRPQAEYSGLRAERLTLVARNCNLAWNAPFGTPAFLDLLARQGPFDMLCHHAAEVKNYKSPDFDPVAATASNTFGLREVLCGLRQAGCGHILLTGSVFEAHEGAGSDPGRAFSAYGLSKTLTSEVFQFHARAEGFSLGKFVIPNPFGPYEERRFTDYLMRCWTEGRPARVAAPLYLRDNIPVTLLAAAYADFTGRLPGSGFCCFNPSFYAETQGAFAQRFADEMSPRLNIATPLEFADQRDFPEPEIRVNTDRLEPAALGWSETDFWDDMAGYYARLLDITTR